MCKSCTEGGRADPAGVLELAGRRVRALADGEHEEYLGVPIGAKFLFRLPSDLPGLLAKVEDSGLAPWQQLEVYRSALLPSLSHHLSSGKVSKDSISHLITRCQDFMRKTANVPMPANTAFFYSDRRTGGLGSQNLSEEADIWTLSTAVQLLESSDHAVRDISAAQLEQTVVAAIERFSQVRNQQQQVAELVRQQDATTESQVRFQAWASTSMPILEFLSGSDEKGLHAARHSSNNRTNLWTRARAAAKHLKGVEIELSSENQLLIVADELSFKARGVVRGLREVCRLHWTRRLLTESKQGRVAAGLALDTSTDVAFLTSVRTDLTFQDWHYIHRARLDLLPVRAIPGSKMLDKKCRLGCDKDETSQHVVACCRHNMALETKRHNEIVAIVALELHKRGYRTIENLAIGNDGLRPDIVIEHNSERLIIDVTVPYDEVENLKRAHAEKVNKYSHLGHVYPFVVGCLGSWLPSNNDIRTKLNIGHRNWNWLRRKARLLAIQGTTNIIINHLGYHNATSYLNSANSDVSNDNRSHDSRSTLNQQNIVES